MVLAVVSQLRRVPVMVAVLSLVLRLVTVVALCLMVVLVTMSVGVLVRMLVLLHTEHLHLVRSSQAQAHFFFLVKSHSFPVLSKKNKQNACT